MHPSDAHRRKSLLVVLDITTTSKVGSRKRTMEFGATILDEGVEYLQDPVRRW